MTLAMKMLNVGVSGNVLINENADRVFSFNVWNYAEGHDMFYRSMLVDLTQPADKASVLSSQRLSVMLCMVIQPAWSCFTKYALLVIVLMVFYLLLTASVLTYGSVYDNVSAISTGNLLLIIIGWLLYVFR